VELFAATSFGRIATRRTSETDAFSAPRMRTPRGPSRTLWSLHRIVSTSDALIVTRRHTRVEILFARCAVHSSACKPHSRTTYRGRRGVDLLVRGPGFASTVSRQDGPKPENAFRRVASLRAFTHKRRAGKIGLIFQAHPHRFAFYPSAPSRQAVLRTSSRLAPSFATTRPCDRPVKKTRDAFNRRLPPKRKRAPAPRAFPMTSAAFTAWMSRGL
jgi:hypothetical protein